MTHMTRIPVVHEKPASVTPHQATPGSAGHDLATAEPLTLTPGARHAVSTGLRMAIPAGCAGLVCPRSGLAAREGISVLNAPGIIDSDYRGVVRVLLVNHSRNTVTLEAGTRVAQLLVVRCEPVEFDAVDSLDDTVRGDGGFGSTGA